MEKHQHESDEDRQKRLQKYDKEREEQRKFVREVTEVFTFTVLPEEQLEGRSACVFSIEPKPEYEPKEKEAKMLKKVHGRLWIDKQEQQWAKIDVQMIDTISFGLFLARLNKGSHLLIEQTRVNDEVWLPKHVSGTVEARLLLLKKLNLGFESTYKDYRKFRTVARMTSTGEEAPEKQ